jgi:hypothetical protein
VLAAVRLVLAAEERADHLDRLLEHLEPFVRPRPPVAEHVLVEILAGPDAEEEAAVHQRLRGCRGVRDDRRVQPDQRARHGGAELDALGRLRDRADHAPDERAVTLSVDPRVDVVGDQHVSEARCLRALRVLDELGGRMLFGGEPVADFHGDGVP